MQRDDLTTSTIMEAAAMLKAGRISSVELTQAVLARIARFDSKLHAYNLVLAETAIKDAAALDEEIASGRIRSPLHGIPVAVKDLCDLAGTPTTCSSPVLADAVAQSDAAVVDKLRAAGAVIVGKTNMTEFALVGYHPRLPAPLNPWGEDRWPGLSSSGTGAAVAASMCFAAIGTDTGGSIRFPAAANGVVGLKPTYGRVSRAGVFPLSDTFDHVGPLARCVADAEAVLEAIAGHDSSDAATFRGPAWRSEAGEGNSVQGLRFGIDEDWIRSATTPCVADAILEAAAVLVDLGAVRVDVAVPEIDQMVESWLVICAVDSLVAHEEIYPEKSLDYGPAFRENLEYGATVTGAAYAQARMVQARIGAVYDEMFRACDVLVTPATADVAGVVGDRSNEADHTLASVGFSMPGNFNGRPSLTLPCGFSPDDMPIALQIVGNLRDETSICRLGRAYESATGWHDRRPEI